MDISCPPMRAPSEPFAPSNAAAGAHHLTVPVALAAMVRERLEGPAGVGTRRGSSSGVHGRLFRPRTVGVHRSTLIKVG